MQIIEMIAELREARARIAGSAGVACVPTMGNLHAGHIELMRLAREHAGAVVATIFVNRLQFAPNEDFDRYPRTFEADCERLAEAGVDIVFAPAEQELYPEPQTYRVAPPAALADILEGEFRPGFFIGVATVVLKLFNIVQPDTVVFGKKDYQQLLIVRNMVRQLALPIQVIGAETMRANGGLALSSRNAYLDSAQRIEAVRLQQELTQIAGAVSRGDRNFSVLEGEAMRALKENGWMPDYVAVRKQTDLQPPSSTDRALVVLGAAKLGTTRLIDNAEVSAPA